VRGIGQAGDHNKSSFDRRVGYAAQGWFSYAACSSITLTERFLIIGEQRALATDLNLELILGQIYTRHFTQQITKLNLEQYADKYSYISPAARHQEASQKAIEVHRNDLEQYQLSKEGHCNNTISTLS